MRRMPLSVFVLLIVCALPSLSCKKEAPGVGPVMAPRDILAGKSVRKNGSISLKVGNVEKSKARIRELVDEEAGQIIEENTSVNADSSLVVKYRIKVRSDAFLTVIDRLSFLGKVQGISIRAEDLTDEMAGQSDRIDLLAARLSEAKRSGASGLADKLQARLSDVRREKAGTAKSLLFSYIYITLIESTKISHAFSLGLDYGLEGFVWMIKALVMLIVSGIPLLIAYLIFRLLRALVKHRWNRLIGRIERIGGDRE